MESNYQKKLGASKGQATLLVLFIPSVDRYSVVIDQETWVNRALETLGNCFGGATAFPKAKGVWRDDASGGNLAFDEPVIINCYTSESELEEYVETLRTFFVDMGKQTNQGAVGLVIDRDYLEIYFPLEGEKKWLRTSNESLRRSVLVLVGLCRIRAAEPLEWLDWRRF